jgi:hypothetical protein
VLKPGFVDHQEERPEPRERRDPRPAPRSSPDWEPDFRIPDGSQKSNYGLILGILAMACGLLGIIPMVSVAGFVFGLTGWIISHDDLNRMKKAKVDPGERRRTRIGLWLAIGGTALSVLGTVAWVVYVWI